MAKPIHCALCTFVVLGALAGCSSKDQLSKFKEFVLTGKIGSYSDYWLVKQTLGVQDPVALIFGYMDDGAACFDIAIALNEKYPIANYTCTLANF